MGLCAVTANSYTRKVLKDVVEKKRDQWHRIKTKRGQRKERGKKQPNEGQEGNKGRIGRRGEDM